MNRVERLGLVLALVSLALPAPSVVVAQSAGRTSADGIYTEAQAERGEETFAQVCSACHGKGQFDESFLRSWTGAPAYYLFDLISATMPQDNPGGLEPAQYADVIAYILEMNGYPAGQAELKPVEDALMAIRLAAPPRDDGDR